MELYPEYNTFKEKYLTNTAQVVWTTISGDLETPVSATIKLSENNEYVSLLESVEGGETRARYSFVSMSPDLIWRYNGKNSEINHNPIDNAEKYKPLNGHPLETLRTIIKDSRFELPKEIPPMSSGLVGYLGYDTIRLIEDIPDSNQDTIGIPDGIFFRPTITIVFDSASDKIFIVSTIRPNGDNPDSAYKDASESLKKILVTLNKPLNKQTISKKQDVKDLPEPESNVGREGYYSMVEKAKEYILEGDAFQIVVSQRLRVPFTLPPFSLYRSLRQVNPSPFLFFLKFPNFSIIGSSPEILVRIREGKITIRPIAGTRPRGKNKQEDETNARELINDKKEIAEHLMLLDLGRHDVGRFAEIGSVKVTEKMIIEYYSHVMHIVSNVEGKLRAGSDPLDALTAGFPAGTVSGAPKVRAMEIIDELENEKRSFYAGAIGYISANGDIDTCITLRTALVKDNELIVQAGGGIVADSDPEMEFQESNNKAGAIIEAARKSINYLY